MSSQRIEVVSYAGYRDEESPRSFIFNGEKVEVNRILERWIEESPDREIRRFFRVRGNDGYTYTLFYDEKSAHWYINSK